MSSNTTKTITSVEKALKIIELISQSENGLTNTEISALTKQGVSATYHLLNTLKLAGYVRQDEKSKRFFIGYSLLRVAKASENQFSLANISEEYLKELTEKSNETSNLVVLEGSNIEYIAQYECSQLLKMFTQIGAKIPYSCTGGGKAIAAFLPEKELSSLLGKTVFTRYTENSCLSAAELKSALNEVRVKGFALDKEEREIGVTCVAAPVFNEKNYPVAAVSISGPTARLKEKGIDFLSEAVIDAARKISENFFSRVQQD